MQLLSWDPTGQVVCYPLVLLKLLSPVIAEHYKCGYMDIVTSQNMYMVLCMCTWMHLTTHEACDVLQPTLKRYQVILAPVLCARTATKKELIDAAKKRLCSPTCLPKKHKKVVDGTITVSPDEKALEAKCALSKAYKELPRLSEEKVALLQAFEDDKSCRKWYGTYKKTVCRPQ